jgi:16S rRNA processing protein RimM
MTDRLEVGRITKPHGIRGEVVVVLTTNRPERVAPGARLTADGRELVVVGSRPHQGGHLVVFAGVADRTAAEALRGRVLTAEPIDDPDELWVHDLVGAEVLEPDGTRRGRVTAVVANPAADLLELDTGALVPLTFVVEHGGGRVVVDPPVGLFDL